MRSTTEVLKSFETAVERYLAELNKLDMGSLLKNKVKRNGPLDRCMYI